MINLLEKNRTISFIFLILIGIEIFFFSSRSSVSGIEKIYFLPVIYHLVVFFLFSFFLIAFLKGKNKIKIFHIITAFTISLIYAILDEIHQFFVLGRDASVKDILTDIIGIIISLLIYSYIDKNN